VSRPDRIRAHFLTCFVALVIMRLMLKLTGRRYSSDRVAECLNRISCSEEQDNIYLLDYRSDISDAIGDALGIDFSRKRLRLSEARHIIAESKR
jgi:hypothetical protein